MSDLLVSLEGVCGRITLNRPQAMHALTLAMVREFYTVLKGWASDSRVEFVLVDGAGDRGLCAGGDVRALYHYAVSGDFDSAATFFREEYRLNFLIARYPKPYVALMDGTVMGGGIGISAHGTHRIVTELSSIAMPETGIGLIPDVGGTYLLGNAREEFGTYLGLTGQRIGAADAMLCGLADMYIRHESLAPLTGQILGCGGRLELEACLQAATQTPPCGTLEGQRDWINACFAADAVETVLERLGGRSEPEAAVAAAAIMRGSPTSLKVTLLALRRGRQQRDLLLCLQQEYALVLACLREGDFVEGVRAALIDRDRMPSWRPNRLADVTEERVESFFAGAGPSQVLSSDWFN